MSDHKTQQASKQLKVLKKDLEYTLARALNTFVKRTNLEISNVTINNDKIDRGGEFQSQHFKVNVEVKV